MSEKPYTYTDVDGDYLRVGKGAYTAYDPSAQQAVSVNTPTGEDAVALARAILTAAGDTKHRVVSEEWLTTVIKINREDAARSMRDRADTAARQAVVVDRPLNLAEQRASIVAAIRLLPLMADAPDTEAAPVYESPEELAQEVARLRRENTALQQIVTRAEKDIAALTRDRDEALEEPAPAPRDTDLTQQVRALVKRYGAPVIAAEAARQARHD